MINLPSQPPPILLILDSNGPVWESRHEYGLLRTFMFTWFGSRPDVPTLASLQEKLRSAIFTGKGDREEVTFSSKRYVQQTMKNHNCSWKLCLVSCCAWCHSGLKMPIGFIWTRRGPVWVYQASEKYMYLYSTHVHIYIH